MDFRQVKFAALSTIIIPLALLFSGCVTMEPASSAISHTEPVTVQPSVELIPIETKTPIPEPTLTPTDLPGFDPQLLGEMTYQLDFLDQALPGSDGSVTLSNGHFEQPYTNSASRVVVDLMNHAVGDLDADGVEDAIALLAISTGGSGTFVNLAAVLQQAGQPVHVATFYVGDRVVVNSMEIEDGVLKVQMIAHAPEDPLCCPSQFVAQEYILQDNMLITQAQSQVLPLAQTAIQMLKAGDMA
ncbi:MAG: hypothetical protein ACWGO1_12425, partial [Anaerolineales bacterium]